MAGSPSVLYGASPLDTESVTLLKATTSKTPIHLIDNGDDSWGAKWATDPEDPTLVIPDPRVHKVQPRNLRGADGLTTRRATPHTEILPPSFLRYHYLGECYVGHSAYTPDRHVGWIQIDCDHDLSEYCAQHGTTETGLKAKIQESLEQLQPGVFKFGLFRTRNYYAVNFYFEHPISRRHQQALSVYLGHCAGWSVHKAKQPWPVEFLPDNPFTDDHPTGRTPIVRGFAIRDPHAVQGVGCLVGGPVETSIMLSPTFPRSHDEVERAADEEDAEVAALLITEDIGWVLERMAQQLETKGLAFSDSMPQFYANVIATSASKQAGTRSLPASIQPGAKMPKHVDAPEHELDEVIEMIEGVAARKSLCVPPWFIDTVTQMSPCLVNKLWDPEVGKDASQNAYGRHVLVECQRAVRMGLIEDDLIEELFILLCHLSMEDGDAPGEVERRGIKPYLRRLHDTTEPKNPSCTDCKLAGICNTSLCAASEGGFLREKGAQAVRAAGIVPLCRSKHFPYVLIVDLGAKVVALPFPAASKIKTIVELFENEGNPVPRLPKGPAWTAMATSAARLTQHEILTQPELRGRNIVGYYSLDTMLLRHILAHWLEPLKKTRKSSGADVKPVTSLGASAAVGCDDQFLYFTWQQLENTAATVRSESTPIYGEAKPTASELAGLFSRADTAQPNFMRGIPAPLPVGGTWCSVPIADIEATAAALSSY